MLAVSQGEAAAPVKPAGIQGFPLPSISPSVASSVEPTYPFLHAFHSGAVVGLVCKSAKLRCHAFFLLLAWSIDRMLADDIWGMRSDTVVGCG